MSNVRSVAIARRRRCQGRRAEFGAGGYSLRIWPSNGRLSHCRPHRVGPAALRCCWLTILGSMRSFGVHSRMSHKATNTSILNRCGGWYSAGRLARARAKYHALRGAGQDPRCGTVHARPSCVEGATHSPFSCSSRYPLFPKSRPQRPHQQLVPVVVRYPGVYRCCGGEGVSRLFLHESFRVVEFDQVSDVRVAKAMQVQRVVQSGE